MTLKNKGLNHFSTSHLVRQVILVVFFVSLTVFAAFSAFTSYSFYTDGQKNIVAEINYLEKVIEGPLKNSLWGVDSESVTEILNVLAKNPNVAKAEIIDSEGKSTMVSSGLSSDWRVLEFPLQYHRASFMTKHLGNLKISLSKNKFDHDLYSNIILSCVQNMVRFVVLAVCIIWLFNRQVISPVREMQYMTNEFNEEHLSPLLGNNFSKSHRNSKSEIGSLHDDIHYLQENFKTAFEMQKKAEGERLEIELQLEKERQKLLLSQRLETIGQITAQVAHDFGNLIMIINGKANILDKRLTEEDDLKQTQAIRKATAKAHSLIKKILAMTRTQKAEPVLMNPFNSLIEIQDLLKISIGSEISLTVETDGNENIIMVEPSGFENVIINLCVNARDAMPGGGRIGINIKSVLKNNQDFVAISVEDTGQGIPEEIQVKIFDPFFTTKAVGKGTGLGLSQVQDFVKTYDGSLELSSCAEGTCFTMYLPNKLIKSESAAA